jgi:hypothetical protein
MPRIVRAHPHVGGRTARCRSDRRRRRRRPRQHLVRGFSPSSSNHALIPVPSIDSVEVASQNHVPIRQLILRRPQPNTVTPCKKGLLFCPSIIGFSLVVVPPLLNVVDGDGDGDGDGDHERCCHGGRLNCL